MSSADTSARRSWPADARVWIVLDRAASAPRSVVETTERAIAGGVDAVVCRLKELPEAEILPLAGQVRELCSRAKIPFVMSHFPELAVKLAADAVQVGASDPPVGDIRDIVGGDIVIGYSSHSIAEANDQLGAGADYIFLGPVYSTPAKLKYGSPLGLDTARRAAAEVGGTMVCIGGINLANLRGLAEAGVTRVAAIAALQQDCDPARRVQEFRDMLRKSEN